VSGGDPVRRAELERLVAECERAYPLLDKPAADFAPDLVAEVVSPNDRPGGLLSNAGQWLDAGTKPVWVFDPARSEAHVYTAGGEADDRSG